MKIADQLCRTILNSPVWHVADSLLAYLSFGKEISLDNVILKSLEAEKHVYVPRISGKTMAFHKITSLDPQEFEINRWGIREPKAGSPVYSGDPRSTLVLVPGLGYTPDGRRMGRGGGYYDRFLSETGMDMIKMGICFEGVLVEDLPTEDHDQSMDLICCGDRLIRIRP